MIICRTSFWCFWTPSAVLSGRIPGILGCSIPDNFHPLLLSFSQPGTLGESASICRIEIHIGTYDLGEGEEKKEDACVEMVAQAASFLLRGGLDYA
jgi:hypothetical protein